MLATCKSEDMFTQEKAVPWSSFFFFKHDMTMQHPAPGSVARNAPDVPVPQPAKITAAMLRRGHAQFDVYCAACHGASGDGEGMIVQRSFPKPPVLFKEDLIKAKAQHFYNVITNGHGVMYSYADRVLPADRWAIVAYIRALQESQHAKVADLPEHDKAMLQEAGQ
jgi:mono/diheme cytochrome c family protein